jgi:hypothetical protein
MKNLSGLTQHKEYIKMKLTDLNPS